MGERYNPAHDRLATRGRRRIGLVRGFLSILVLGAALVAALGGCVVAFWGLISQNWGAVGQGLVFWVGSGFAVLISYLLTRKL